MRVNVHSWTKKRNISLVLLFFYFFFLFVTYVLCAVANLVFKQTKISRFEIISSRKHIKKKVSAENGITSSSSYAWVFYSFIVFSLHIIFCCFIFSLFYGKRENRAKFTLFWWVSSYERLNRSRLIFCFFFFAFFLLLQWSRFLWISLRKLVWKSMFVVHVHDMTNTSKNYLLCYNNISLIVSIWFMCQAHRSDSFSI